MNANLCPVALYHDLVHGIDNALLGHYTTQRRGDLFSGFVAYLKMSLKNGTLDIRTRSGLQVARIRNAYLQFCEKEHIPLGKSQDIWGNHIEPWVIRQLESGELEHIDNSARFFFEISVSNPKLPIELNEGTRTYPLRGRIDEIDISGKKIVERTIRGEGGNKKPPLLKDYQVWLLWRILCSLDKSQLPTEWRAVDFSKFQLVVETPHGDFTVSDGGQFLGDTHAAYAWINDISLSESHGVFTEVFENAQCVPEKPNEFCFHPFINCWPPRYDLPRSRPEIRQAFHPWYRLLLWEQIWRGHLWQYQLHMLDNDDLLKMGLVLPTKVTAVENDHFRLQVKWGSASPMRGLEHCTIIPFGTVYCGLRVNAIVRSAEKDTLELQAKNTLGKMQLPRIHQEALIISSTDQESPIMSEPPVFLQQQTQRSLFRLKGIGTDNPEKAKKRSVIQILEAMFGTRPIRREKQ
jgi:hypothetical protein